MGKLDILTKLSTVFGSRFIHEIEDTFEKIKKHANEKDEYDGYHRFTQEDAHNSSQIGHTTKDNQKTRVDNELRYQRQQIKELVLGHNGDGVQELRASRTSMDAIRHDDLSNRLYHDFLREQNERERIYKELDKRIKRVVNVDDYGADPTGQKDSTKAFVDAFADGGRQVTMSAGTYIVQGLKLPNDTFLKGQGADVTTIKLADNAPASAVVVTNLVMSGGAENITVEDLSIDGNRTRQGNTLKPAGGSLSSGLRFAGVKYGVAKNIKTANTLLHGIDVTYASDDYYYEGDGNRVSESLESKHILIDNCEATKFGDDGITTHHSRYLIISNSYAHHPAVAGGGNNNGIEIDDGSQYVFLNNNKSEMCYGGLEIKGHAPTSAASKVFVNGHLSIMDTRAYNIRHIGHHSSKRDPKSKTAFDIALNNCTAMQPYYNGQYPNTTPRAMVICAYRNVSVNNFTAVGDSRWTSGQPVVVVQFMAENVNISNVNIRGFKNASADLKIMGGDNKPKKVTFSNINIFNSSDNCAIQGGGGVYDTKIIGANLLGNGSGNGVEMYNNTAEIMGVMASGFKNAAVIGKVTYNVVPTVLKGGFSAGSTGSLASKEASAILASTGGSQALSDRSAVLTSGMGCKAHGSRTIVMNSLESETSPGNHTQMVINSRGVRGPQSNYRVVGGYGANGASTKNIKFELNTLSGDLKLAGQLTSSNSFADYAELFESQSGQAIPTGMIVTLDGRHIRRANKNDVPLGVISETAGVILGDQTFHYKGRYLRNKFGGLIYEDKYNEWFDEKGNKQSEVRRMPIENPEYDPSEDYQARMDRPEWNVVGLIGQVHIRVKENVSVNDSIRAEAGIGVKDNENGYWRVMDIKEPYNANDGYAVAVCMIK